MPEQISKLFENFATLGVKRVAILGAVAAISLGFIMFGATVINKPSYQAIYIDLGREDVVRMGAALGEVGIPYDVNAEGNAILVAANKTSEARMVLAEKGLPNGSSSGYELFDNIGSLGLTSFMQEVTRVRALEGEIGRSILTIRGVKGARVHIVMSDDGGIRRERQQPTASVVIRYEGNSLETSAQSIRHLVSSAVPGLLTENVTVLDASGRLIAAGADPLGASAGSAVGLKTTLENELVDSIHRALVPYLGAQNFRVSVQADINTDQKQIEETTFDPDSRVERSVEVVRLENSLSENSSGEAATIEQELVGGVDAAQQGNAATERSERREETTNYEINSTRTVTVRNAFSVDRLSVAVVVNSARMLEALGENATAAQITEEIAKVRQLAFAAAGMSDERGDVIEVSSVQFLESEITGGIQEASFLSGLQSHVSALINGLAFIAVGLAMIFLVLRPMLNAVSQPGGGPALAQDDLAALEAPAQALPASAEAAEAAAAHAALNDAGQNGAIPLGPQQDILSKMQPAIEDRLAMIVDLDEERAAAILRRWVREEPA